MLILLIGIVYVGIVFVCVDVDSCGVCAVANVTLLYVLLMLVALSSVLLLVLGVLIWSRRN